MIPRQLSTVEKGMVIIRKEKMKRSACILGGGKFLERSDENKNKIRVSGIRVTRVRVCVYTLKAFCKPIPKLHVKRDAKGRSVVGSRFSTW